MARVRINESVRGVGINVEYRFKQEGTQWIKSLR